MGPARNPAHRNLWRAGCITWSSLGPAQQVGDSLPGICRGDVSPLPAPPTTACTPSGLQLPVLSVALTYWRPVAGRYGASGVGLCSLLQPSRSRLQCCHLRFAAKGRVFSRGTGVGSAETEKPGYQVEEKEGTLSSKAGQQGLNPWC